MGDTGRDGNDVIIYTGEIKGWHNTPDMEDGVVTPFPRPSADFGPGAMVSRRVHTPHKEATFYARVCRDTPGNTATDKGDVVVIDRATEAEPGDVVVAYDRGLFRLKLLENPAGTCVWGVVVWVFKRKSKTGHTR